MKQLISIVLSMVMVLSGFTVVPVSISAKDVTSPIEADLPDIMWEGASVEKKELYPTGGYMPEMAQTARSAQEEKALELAAEKLLTQIKGNTQLNAVEKALLVHDRLAAWVDYDYYTYRDDPKKYDADSYTKYGALLKHKAVCGGYADAYSYLMNKIGIQTEYIGSTALNHGWNIVVINNKPYYVDVTWDDCHMGYIEHDNFLRSYQGFVATGHTASDYQTSYKGMPINDTTYDTYYWQDSYSEFLLAEYRSTYKIYYYDHAKGELKIANDNHKVIYTVPADDFVEYDRCTYLCRTNDTQLFSYAGKVYRIEPRTDSVITNQVIAGLDQLNIAKLEGIIEDEYGESVDDYSWEMTGSILKIKGTGRIGDHFRLKENGCLDHYCCLPPGIKMLVETVILPNGITGIPNQLFGRFSKLKSITIPDGVQTIGNSAFFNCTALSDVTIPDSVKTIGDYAFSHCTGLTKVKIGKGVQQIGKYAFGNCSALTEVYIADLAAWMKISFGDDYSSNPLYYAKKLYLNGKLLTDLVIPSGVTSIPVRAFYEIETFKSVIIPDSVKTIGDSAFYNCTGLTKVKMGKGVQQIGKYAFSNCSALAELDIADLAAWLKISFGDDYSSNPMIYAKKLYLNGKLLTDLVIPSGITSIPDNAFYGIETIKSIAIPDSVKTIGDSAFYNCTGLTKVKMGKDVQQIGKYAFSNCSALAELDIADIAAWLKISFGDDYFSNPMSYAKKLYLNGKLLTDLVIPSGITSIPDNAFYGIETIKSITIPDSVKTIGDDAFYNCTGLTKVKIGKGVQQIGKYAFSNCSALAELDIADIAAWLKISFGDDYFSNPMSYAKKLYLNGKLLTDLVIPSGITSIPDNAFYGIETLKSVTIPDSVKTIGADAFFNCTGLTKVKMGKGVQQIGKYAFGNCSALAELDIADLAAWLKISFGDDYSSNPMIYAKKLYLNGKLLTNLVIPNGVTSIPVRAFYGIESIKSVTIPDSVKTIGDYAFYNCTGLTKVKMGKGVQQIGKYAFSYCYDLSDVTIPNSVKTIGDYAFNECYQIDSLIVPAEVKTIGQGAIPSYCDIYGKKGSAAEKYAKTNSNSFIPFGEDVAGETGSWSWNLGEDLTLTIKGKGKTDNNLKESGGYYTLTEVPWGSRVKKVVIESGITQLGDYAMHDCTGIESVSIAKSVKLIGDYAFSGCSGLTEVNIPDGVTEIGAGAFSDCSGLTKVTIGKGVKTIDYAAFVGCNNLRSITLPANVTEIGWRAFGYTYDPDTYDFYQINGFTVYGYKGTAAQRYAEENGFKFVDLSAQSSIILGDTDGNGMVDVADATMIGRHLVSLKTRNYIEAASDVDRDGRVTILDVTGLQRYLANLPTTAKEIGKII